MLQGLNPLAPRDPVCPSPTQAIAEPGLAKASARTADGLNEESTPDNGK